MKKVLFSLAALSLSVGAPSFAKEKKVTTTTTTYEESGSGGGGGGGIWVGVALNNLIAKLNAATTATLPASLSAQFGLGRASAIQTYAALYGVNGTVTFGIGADVKFAVVGDNRKGFHLGGGFGFGTTAGTFFANFAGNIGPHFTIDNNILISADAGPLLTVGGGTDFALTGRSILLGLSMLMKL